MNSSAYIRRLLAIIAGLAVLTTLVLTIDALRAGRIPRSGHPLEASRTATLPLPPLPPPAATNARLTIDWEDPDGRTYRSHLALEPDAVHPVAATIVTCDHGNGQELVRYRARAQRTDDGTLIIDAAGAAVSGPYAEEWSPDSFTITRTGRVTTRDATNAPGNGWLVQEDAFIPGK